MVLISVMSLSSFARAGEWTRIDTITISFKGEIKVDEYDRFSAVFDSQVRQLIVDSGGGETKAGLKIGRVLRQADIGIRVDHWCLSSCANYLFLGATRREIATGIVGFHGNVTACFGGLKWHEVEKRMKELGKTAREIEEFRVDTLQQIDNEKIFFQMVGVSQVLFDRSCKPDKGLGDGVAYDFLLPTTKTFERYGVHGVIGLQDLETAKQYPNPLAIE